MKQGIHPEYREVCFVDLSNGFKFVTRTCANTKETVKMDGQVQEAYPRKNWSSLILFNCGHPANRVLDLEMVNTKDPGFLHRFSWLKDEEIGKLPFHWNYLEGWYKSDDARAVHYTRGGPWFPDWQHVDYAEEWFAEFEAYSRSLEKSQETK